MEPVPLVQGGVQAALTFEQMLKAQWARLAVAWVPEAERRLWCEAKNVNMAR